MGHMRPSVSETHGRCVLLSVRPFCPSAPTMAPAAFSLRAPAASPFQAQGEISPGKTSAVPHGCRIYAASLRHESFVVSGSPVLVHRASDPVSVRHPRIRSTLLSAPTSRAVPAFRFGPRDQVPGGLSPPSRCPCRAHRKQAHPVARVRLVCRHASDTGRTGSCRKAVLPQSTSPCPTFSRASSRRSRASILASFSSMTCVRPWMARRATPALSLGEMCLSSSPRPKAW